MLKRSFTILDYIDVSNKTFVKKWKFTILARNSNLYIQINMELVEMVYIEIGM